MGLGVEDWAIAVLLELNERLFGKFEDYYTEDYLRPLNKWIMLVIRHKFFNVLNALKIIIFLTYSFFQFIYIMDNDTDVRFILKFLPLWCLFPSSLIFRLIIYAYSKTVLQKGHIRISTGDNDIQKGTMIYDQIKKESLLVNLFFCIILVCSFVAFCSFLPIFGDENETFFVLFINEKWFPPIINTISYTVYPIIALEITATLVTLCIAFMYIAFHVKFQTMILIHITEEKFSNIKFQVYSEPPELYLYIVFITQKHLLFKRSLKMFEKKISFPILLATSTGFLTSVNTFIFLYLGISPRSNFRMIMLLINIYCNILIYSCLSQSIIDKWEEFYLTWVRLPWYKWSKKNRMAYMMLLQNAQIPVDISAWGIIELNNMFLLKISRVIYSIANIIRL